VSEPGLAADAGPRWGLNPLIELEWRVWDSACVAYEGVSGETSIVEAFEAATLACLKQQPCGLGQIVLALSRELATEPTEGFAQAVARTLEELHWRGWVERSEPGA
jgi:PqqD family protein of HPr-rel-A system